jgi:hypothetical protein
MVPTFTVGELLPLTATAGGFGACHPAGPFTTGTGRKPL